jgi:hypothetical protein
MNSDCCVIVRGLKRDENLQKTLQDFFSFCGQIKSVKICEDTTPNVNVRAPESVCGIIQFEKPDDTKTAILLNNTQINDRYISVEAYHPDKENQTNTQNDNKQTAEETGPISGLFSGAANAVRTIDENIHFTETVGSVVQKVDESVSNLNQEYQISQKLAAVGEGIKEKAMVIDNTLGISNNAQFVGNSIKGSLTKLDEDHHITERVSQTGAAVSDALVTGVQSGVQTISTGVQNASASVSEFLHTNETAKTGMDFVSDVGESVTNTLNSLWSSIAPNSTTSPQPAHQTQPQQPMAVNANSDIPK